jgi:hypothetical protein
VEVQYGEVALVLAQWVRPSEVNLLLGLEFHTGAQTVMKRNHPLLKMEL